MIVLLTGATGLVGKELGKKLVEQGHRLVVVSRNAKNALESCPFPCQVIEGDLSKEPIKSDLLSQIQAVIHLAGESVAEARWSDVKKMQIYNSRVLGTKNLIISLAEAKAPLRAFISTSASGFYGDQGDKILPENSIRGSGFLSDVCRDWEREVEMAQSKQIFANCRFVILRVGVVLSVLGGAMLKMIHPFRLGIGGAVGSGKQWMGWIHLVDLVQIYASSLIDENYQGVINAVAPETITNLDFSKKLAAVFGKKLGPAIPKAVLKLIFGEMSHVLLSSQRLEAKALDQLQFRYQYPQLDQAFAEICQYHAQGDEVLISEQYLDYDLQKIFPFFSDAKNLERITPEYLNFKVVKMSTQHIEANTLIDYKLKIHGVPVAWRTQILDWVPPVKFTDTQLKGPYKKWHHTHDFTKLGQGVLMKDRVLYRLPFGLLGWALAFWFVKKDVTKIFLYRRKVCSTLNFEQM